MIFQSSTAVKKSFFFLAAAVAAITISSCGDDVETFSFDAAPSPLEGVGQEVAQRASESLSEVHDSISICLGLLRGGLSRPVASRIDSALVSALLGEEFGGMDVADAVEVYGNELKSKYITDSAELLNESEESVPPVYMFDLRHYINASVYSVTDNLVQYLAETYFYTGGAHGYGSSVYLAFDKKSGSRLNLGDIIADMDAFKHSMSARILADDRTFEDSEYAEPSSFAIESDGITFYYDPYIIGCYASGQIDYFYSDEDIAPMLAPDALKYFPAI